MTVRYVSTANDSPLQATRFCVMGWLRKLPFVTRELWNGCCNLSYCNIKYIHNIVLEETWEHVSMHWQQGRYLLWVNCLTCWTPALNAVPGVSQVTPPPIARVSQLWPIRQKNGLTLAVWYHAPGIIVRRFWTGAIFYWAACTWH